MDILEKIDSVLNEGKKESYDKFVYLIHDVDRYYHGLP